MASAGDDNEICEEDEDTANNAAKVSSNNEGMRRSSSDSKIKKLRRKISQGLRLSFIKDENDVSNISDESQIENDVFDSNSNPSLTSSKLAARPVVRRSASDSIGARLRKISFEIGNGRRNSDDLSPDELKNIPQELALLKAKEPSHAIQ